MVFEGLFSFCASIRGPPNSENSSSESAHIPPMINQTTSQQPQLGWFRRLLQRMFRSGPQHNQVEQDPSVAQQNFVEPSSRPEAARPEQAQNGTIGPTSSGSAEGKEEDKEQKQQDQSTSAMPMPSSSNGAIVSTSVVPASSGISPNVNKVAHQEHAKEETCMNKDNSDNVGKLDNGEQKAPVQSDSVASVSFAPNDVDISTSSISAPPEQNSVMNGDTEEQATKTAWTNENNSDNVGEDQTNNKHDNKDESDHDDEQSRIASLPLRPEHHALATNDANDVDSALSEVEQKKHDADVLPIESEDPRNDVHL